MIQWLWWWISAGWVELGWAELVQTGLGSAAFAVCRINTVLLTHCSIERDILYLCHTHNLMNMVILVLLWSFLEHCLIHLVHLLLFMQTRCTRQRRIIGGSNAFSLWHCYCFECENITAFVASWKGKFREGALGAYIKLPQSNKVWCFQELQNAHTHKHTDKQGLEEGHTVACFITEYETHSI